MHVNVFDFSELLARSTERYLEFVRVSSFSVGIYVLDGGAKDPQKPHSEEQVPARSLRGWMTLVLFRRRALLSSVEWDGRLGRAFGKTGKQEFIPR